MNCSRESYGAACAPVSIRIASLGHASTHSEHAVVQDILEVSAEPDVPVLAYSGDDLYATPFQVQMAAHSPETAREFLRLISTLPEVVACWTLTGEAD